MVLSEVTAGVTVERDGAVDAGVVDGPAPPAAGVWPVEFVPAGTTGVLVVFAAAPPALLAKAAAASDARVVASARNFVLSELAFWCMAVLELLYVSKNPAIAASSRRACTQTNWAGVGRNRRREKERETTAK